MIYVINPSGDKYRLILIDAPWRGARTADPPRVLTVQYQTLSDAEIFNIEFQK